MTTADFVQDIPRSVAQGAHNGTSFVPERRAEQEQQGYAETLLSDYNAFAAVAEKHGTTELLAEQFERYRTGCKRRTLEYLHSRGGLVSTMIAGGSNFPVRRMQRKGDAVHKRLEALIEFRKRARAVIMRKLAPTQGAIMASQPDAVDLLAQKISQAEKLQEAMRAGNKIVRNKNLNDEQKVAQLVGLGLRESTAREVITPDYMGRIGFPDYALKNNNANIRRMKSRVVVVSAAKATAATETQGTTARIEDCPADNRVRLFFPGKPDEATRGKLKLRGFRWTPSLGCWQAFRNSSSAEIAREVAGIA